MHPLALRDVGVRHEDRAHPHLLGAVDVVPRAVADEDDAGRVGHADGCHRGAERVDVRLPRRGLAGVDRAVDEVQDAVAGEHGLVVLARPHRVGQDADLDAVGTQRLEHRHDVGIGVGVRVPRLEVGLHGLGVLPRAGVDARELEDPLEVAGARGAAGLALTRPDRLLGVEEPLRELLGVGGVVDLGVGVPLRHEVERVPRRERAAPVEQDGLDGSGHARQTATMRSRASATASSVRSPVARSLSSTTPSTRPLPTTTIVGTPSSSESLNFTPGEAWRRSS